MSCKSALKKYEEAHAAAVEARREYIAEALACEAKQYIEWLGGAGDHEAYLEKVVPYWERFGYVPEELWFDLAGSRDHVTDPRFMPLDLLFNGILPYLNNLQFWGAMADKSNFGLMFPDARQPKTVCHRIAGEFYDDGMTIISRDEALKLCMDRACVIFLKPSVYTWAGKGISAPDTREISAGELDEIFDRTGMNFIVQEMMSQHPNMAELNPDSVSAIRINTLLMDGEVRIVSEAVKVGTPGKRVQLRGNGDYITQIHEDGSLHDKVLFTRSISEEGDHERFRFEWGSAKEYGLFSADYRLPSLDKVRALARKLAARLARFRFIGWDFAVDREGEPVLIELNISPGEIAGQLAIGSPMFGDMTDRVLEDYFLERSLEKAQKQGLLVQ